MYILQRWSIYDTKTVRAVDIEVRSGSVIIGFGECKKILKFSLRVRVHLQVVSGSANEEAESGCVTEDLILLVSVG